MLGWTNSTFPAEVSYSNPRSAGQRKGRRVCFTVMATLTYRAVPVPQTIMWDPHPPACDQCACNAERDDWQMRLRNHEMIHAQEATDAAARLTEQTKPFLLKACVAAGPGVTWVSARPSFDAQALAHAERESRIARRYYDLEQDKFDRSRVGAVPLPNCAKCMPCAAGQQPSCSVCSPRSNLAQQPMSLPVWSVGKRRLSELRIIDVESAHRLLSNSNAIGGNCCM